jgi:hypothetical protein
MAVLAGFGAMLAAALPLAQTPAPAAATITTPPPVLRVVEGVRLRWTIAGTRNTYRVLENIDGVRTSTIVTRRTYVPADVPGQTVTFRVKAAYGESAWSNPVSITYAPLAEELPSLLEEPEPEEPRPVPLPEAPHPPGTGGEMTIALNAGGWGASAFGDIAGAARSVRLETRFATESEVAGAAAAGVTVGSWLKGTGGTIGSIDPNTYANEVVTLFKRYGRGGTFWAGRPADLGGDTIEVLNEPGNPYFWSDPGNYGGYVTLVHTVKQALVRNGLGWVKVLVSWDGGYGGDSYGLALLAAGLKPEDYDGVTVHPYGGHGTNSAEGNRARAVEAHAQSGKLVYVTEIGWPTAVGQPATGDSLQWTQAQQAENLTSFIEWARETGYVAMVDAFTYVDYGTNDFYGIETKERVHKLSYGALAEASR